MSFRLDICPVPAIVRAKGRLSMRLARILVGAWLVLGGVTACSDHNPTVVFTGDAGVDGKGEAGIAQDGGGNHDGGTVAEVAVTVDGGGPAFEVLLPVDLAPQGNTIPDASSPVDLGVGPDLALDSNQATDSPAVADVHPAAIDVSPAVADVHPAAIDVSPAGIDVSPAAIDGASSTLDGSVGTSLEVGIDSSAVHDGGGTAG
jgi:hypothetical protein